MHSISSQESCLKKYAFIDLSQDGRHIEFYTDENEAVRDWITVNVMHCIKVDNIIL